MSYKEPKFTKEGAKALAEVLSSANESIVKGKKTTNTKTTKKPVKKAVKNKK